VIEKLRIYLSQIFAVFLLVTVCVSSSLWEGSVPLISTTLFFLGAIMVSIASLGRLWCSVYIAGYKTDHLVTSGPYSMCRNPLYFFSLIGALGVGFASENVLIPFLVHKFCACSIRYHSQTANRKNDVKIVDLDCNKQQMTPSFQLCALLASLRRS